MIDEPHHRFFGQNLKLKSHDSEVMPDRSALTALFNPFGELSDG